MPPALLPLSSPVMRRPRSQAWQPESQGLMPLPLLPFVSYPPSIPGAAVAGDGVAAWSPALLLCSLGLWAQGHPSRSPAPGSGAPSLLLLEFCLPSACQATTLRCTCVALSGILALSRGIFPELLLSH